MRKRLPYKKPIQTETTELCKYGCGRTAKFKTGGGDFICDSSPNRCPANKEKNSKGGKSGYLKNTRKSMKEVYASMSEESKSRMCWSAGLTKDTDERIKKSAIALKQKYDSGELKHIPCKHTDETKKKLSEKRIKFLEENPNHNIKWYIVNDIKVQGLWEKSFAERLNEIGVKWERKSLNYLQTRKYTPDFYLIDYDIYVEVKGFMRERDKAKMYAVLNEHNIDIRIVESMEEIKSFEVENSRKFVEEYSKESIDWPIFKNHWK